MPRVLVVDDDRAIQNMIVDLLAKHGYEVVTANNGNEAVAQLENETLDLAILDVLIPNINGFDLIEKIRSQERLKTLPVIMLSGIYRSRNHEREMLERFNVLAYLEKPFEVMTLLEMVQNELGPGTEQASNLEASDEAPTRVDHGSGEQWVEPSAKAEKREVERDARTQFKQSAFLSQGSIKKTPVPEVIGEIWAQKRSGALLLRSEKTKKVIYFREGDPFHVKSNLVSECLGRLLVKERMITPEQCTASLSEMKRSGRLQGEILVEMNSISEKNLDFALELQVETKLFEPFSWTTGEFRFNPTAELPSVEPHLDWNGASTVVEGVRRAYDETRLRSQMVSILSVPVEWCTTNPELEKLGFNSREKAAAQRINDGDRTEHMLMSLGLTPPNALQLVYSLVALKLLGPQIAAE